MRTVAQSFLTNPVIPSMPTIFRGWDNQMQLVASGSPDAQVQTMGCIHIMEEDEERLSVPAVQGYTLVDYVLQLQAVVLLDGNGEDMVDATDAAIEAVKARLRSDPYMGQIPAVIFQSAQSKGKKISVKRGDVLYLNTGLANGTPVQWFNIMWTATEQITA